MKTWRLNLIFCLFFIISAVICWRLFNLQILKNQYYLDIANAQNKDRPITNLRGQILMQNNEPLIINKNYTMVYAVPAQVNDPKITSQKLDSLLKIDEQTIFKRLNKPNDPYEPLENRLLQETTDAIQGLNLDGIKIAQEKLRYYPEQEIFGHMTGFVDKNNKGQYGLESYYDKYLKNGNDLYLTIDRTVQILAWQNLEKLIKKYNPESVSIVVMETKTGRILAMVSAPSYNPNEYFKIKDMNLFLNPVVSTRYEPGSVIKPLTMAAGLDAGKITPETIYKDKGSLHLDGYTIRNAQQKTYGVQTMTQVLEKSINTGAVFAQEQLEKKEFKRYFEKFGLNKKTNIDLTGEIIGDISNLDQKNNINYATASFGQGIAVTPMALLNAINAIANQGQLMQPYLVEKIMYNNKQVQSFLPKKIKQVISRESARKLTGMMVSVVENGFANQAKIPGFLVTGKTGTAQIPGQGGYTDEIIHSFVGFAPAFDPKVAVLLKLDKPNGVLFAGTSLAPVFSDLIGAILNYYQIQPKN
ncbi:hypothetical protein CL633_03690 [bacterium]|nr:hypothetical protein [bacterium]|tara:strand:- start:1521 stop:3104 length:1584 start_codon:yes stop_codon:yes gene_type:complete